MKRFVQHYSRQILTFLLIPTILLISQPVYAASAWEDALQKVVDIFTGNTSRLLAILAVAGFGIGALFGRVSWRRAGEIVLGIAIVFGAVSIVDMFVGK